MKALISLMFFLPLPLIAQTVEETDALENARIIFGDDFDLSQTREKWSQLKNNPINLNFATKTQLQETGLFTPAQLDSLILYRSNFGLFQDWQELSRIEGISFELIEKLKEFCSIEFLDDASTIKTGLRKGRFEQTVRISSTLITSKGYQLSRGSAFPAFEGSPYRLYTRTRYAEPGKFSVGVLSEKDPGEKTFNSKHPVSPDFTSAHFYLRKKGLLQTLVIGDYNFSSGLGLVLNTSGGMFKSAQLAQVYRPLNGIRPYTSVNESGYFRGIGVTLGKKDITASLLTSFKRIDATTNDLGEITSLYNTGLHRTSSELLRRKSAIEMVIGAQVKYEKDRLTYDVSLITYSLSRNVTLSFLKPVIGSSIHYQASKGILFGEIGYSFGREPALLAGHLTTITKALNALVIFRNYPADFRSPYGAAFSNSGKLSNERGIFTGLEYQLDHKNKVSAYIDQFTYPQASFYSAYASVMRDGVAQWTYTIKRRFLFYIRGRWQLQPQDFQEDKLERSSTFTRAHYRLHVEYQAKSGLVFKQRLEANKGPVSTGWLWYQDILYKKIGFKHILAFRLALFDCANYDDRVYAYENDLLFSYSIPAYFNRGSRWYLMIHGPVTKQIDYWIRYANWNYNGLKSVGSGNDEIAGNKKPQLEVQLRLLLK